jgi:CheY-like chemotaxis protein
VTASKVAKMSDKSRILIVDDDEVVRRSYLRSLQSVDCNVAAASDGEEALQTMEKNTFDVVLLDLRMPGRNVGAARDQTEMAGKRGGDHHRLSDRG